MTNLITIAYFVFISLAIMGDIHYAIAGGSLSALRLFTTLLISLFIVRSRIKSEITMNSDEEKND